MSFQKLRGKDGSRARTALTTAASMIEDYVSSGVDPDDIGLTDKQLEIMDQENKKLAAKLYAMAEKLEKQG
ncbi:hypothetical protein [Vibrio vulnificus]|uniref:hypothetical protein n=1 Tax=Vibrio vulnificus TaxID=672 RepID=UPI003242F7AA